MKKVILTFLVAIGFSIPSFAQEVTTLLPNDITNGGLTIVEPAQKVNNSTRRANDGGWYSYINAFAFDRGLTDGNGNLTTGGSVFWLFPDTAQVQYSTGEMGRIRMAVAGSVFDPKDPLFNAPSLMYPDARQLSRWNSYSWDSLAWTQFYIRQADSISESDFVNAQGTVEILDYTDLEDAVFEINGIELTEGLEWDAAGDNNTTAASLADAIEQAGFDVEVNDSIITITANVAGEAGNSITMSSDNTNLELSDATLTGGSTTITNIEVVDTLFVQYFKSDDMNFGSYYNRNEVSDGGDTTFYYYGMPNVNGFSTKTLLNSTAFKTDTVLLTGEFADSTAGSNVYGRGVITVIDEFIEGGNNINSNIVSTLFTFKPMQEYSKDDTIVSFFEPNPVAKKHNLLGIRFIVFDGVSESIPNPEALNLAIVTNFEVRYGQTLTNLLNLKSYIPGVFFANTIFPQNDYHITISNLDVATPDANGYALGNAFPNPTVGAMSFNIPFTLGAAQNVTFNVKDITGRTVKTISSNFNAGDNIVEVETAGLSAGMYIIQMATENFTAASKIIVE